MSNVKMVCNHCGSQEVKKDAWAVWDVEKQDWVLGQEFDNGYCENCEGETLIDEVIIT